MKIKRQKFEFEPRRSCKESDFRIYQRIRKIGVDVQKRGPLFVFCNRLADDDTNAIKEYILVFTICGFTRNA